MYVVRGYLCNSFQNGKKSITMDAIKCKMLVMEELLGPIQLRITDKHGHWNL